MTGQNDRQDRSLTGQVRDQAGHCPLTGRYYLRLLYVLLLACRTRHYMQKGTGEPMHSLSRASSVMQQRWMTSSKLMLNKEVLYRRPAHCTILIHAFIMSKLDYCNSLLSGLREDHITKFQLMQILPHARLLTGNRKHVH